MANISVSLSDDLYKKLQKLSVKSGQSLEDSVALALSEYVENYEDSYTADLNSVNQLERSFFFSVAE